MGEMRKITAFVPADLLDRVQAASGVGLTETLKLALEEYAIARWSDRVLALAGKIDFSGFDLEALREDREFDGQGNVL